MISRDWFWSSIADFHSTANAALDPEVPDLKTLSDLYLK